MQLLRTAVHISFDAAAAFLYSGSIAVVVAAVAYVCTQTLSFGLAIAALSFLLIWGLWSRALWRRYRSDAQPDRTRLFAH